MFAFLSSNVPTSQFPCQTLPVFAGKTKITWRFHVGTLGSFYHNSTNSTRYAALPFFMLTQAISIARNQSLKNCLISFWFDKRRLGTLNWLQIHVVSKHRTSLRAKISLNEEVNHSSMIIIGIFSFPSFLFDQFWFVELKCFNSIKC